MAKITGRRRIKDPTSGGKRAAPVDDRALDRGDSAKTVIGASLARGIEVIAERLKTLPATPGVYRMLDGHDEVLYVGKAHSLRKRVLSYTQPAKLPRRLQRMVAETCRLEVVTTHSEIEALLLESNLIKRFQPRYNVLLRDDKSFPYILLTKDHQFAQVTKHRGAHQRDGDYFGPFASAGAVNRTITALEKAFLLRSCSDPVFATRTRPCLMFQIKRCSAPCVGRVTQSDYDRLVVQTRAFLTGGSDLVQQELSRDMQAAAERLDFEAAAVYRDRIKALAHIRSRQDVNVEGLDDADVLAAYQDAGQTCIQVFFFRAGRNYGNRAFFPSHDRELDVVPVLSAFVAQFYDGKPPPSLVLLSHDIEQPELVAQALSQRAGRKVRLHRPQRGARRKLVDGARQNAREALARRLSESSSQRRVLEELAGRLGLEAAPERIEVYDNSHIQGVNAYGAMIVAGPEGFRKSSYRKFLIRGARPAADTSDEPSAETGGFSPRDDYAMMRQVIQRRFSRALKEDPERQSDQWPDLVLLDGGRGQLSAARGVLEELGLEDLSVVAIAKGPNRDAGRERIFTGESAPLLLKPRDPVLYFLQRLRDEAHRFAIGSHRRGRSTSRLRSVLDEIAGIGAKRKKALLHHFGSARAVGQAGLDDLEAVEGISKTVARKIYDHFHGAAVNRRQRSCGTITGSCDTNVPAAVNAQPRTRRYADQFAEPPDARQDHDHPGPGRPCCSSTSPLARWGGLRALHPWRRSPTTSTATWRDTATRYRRSAAFWIRSPTSCLVAAVILMLVAIGAIRGWVILPALVILCAGRSWSRACASTWPRSACRMPVSQLAKWKTAIQLLALGILIVGESGPVRR